MHAFVFVLILFLSPDGDIIGYADGIAADINQCHEMIAEKLKQPDTIKLLESGAKARGACTNTKPLPSDESNHFQPRPPIATGSTTI